MVLHLSIENGWNSTEQKQSITLQSQQTRLGCWALVAEEVGVGCDSPLTEGIGCLPSGRLP